MKQRYRLRWLRLQYRLSTLLVLMLVTAIACGWFFRPRTDDIPVADGTLVIRQQVRAEGREPTASGNGGTDQGVKSGRWLLLDREEFVLQRGRYAADRRHGRWTTYHGNGVVALQGACRDGTQVGRWQAWYSHGEPQAEWEYARPVDAERKTGDTEGAVLEGPTRSWWPNRQPIGVGQYTEGKASGDWTFHNQTGQLSAAGPYRNGLRHGTWTVRDRETGETSEVEFAHGKPVQRTERDRLVEQLLGGDLQERLAAARALERFGPLAAEALVPALSSDERTVRLLAVRTLAHIGLDAQAANRAIKPLANDPDPRVRRYALLALFLLEPSRREVLYSRLNQGLRECEPRIEFDFLLRVFIADRAFRPEVFPRLLELAEAGDNGTMLFPLLDQCLGIEAESLALLQAALGHRETSIRLGAAELLSALSSQTHWSSHGPWADLQDRLAELLKIAAADSHAQVSRTAQRELDRRGPRRIGGMGGGMF